MHTNTHISVHAPRNYDFRLKDKKPFPSLCLPCSLSHLSFSHRCCAVHSSIFPLLPNYSVFLSYLFLFPVHSLLISLSHLFPTCSSLPLSLSAFLSQEVCSHSHAHTHTVMGTQRGAHKLFLSWKVANLCLPWGHTLPQRRKEEGREEREIETRGGMGKRGG